MPSIKGPITFTANEEIPKELQNAFKDSGVKLPFDPVACNMDYSNTKIDNWFRVKKASDKYKFNRSPKGWIKE